MSNSNIAFLQRLRIILYACLLLFSSFKSFSSEGQKLEKRIEKEDKEDCPAVESNAYVKAVKHFLLDFGYYISKAFLSRSFSFSLPILLTYSLYLNSKRLLKGILRLACNEICLVDCLWILVSSTLPLSLFPIPHFIPPSFSLIPLNV